MTVSKYNPVIAWWSGGVASAVTCKLCVDWFGSENVRVIFIDPAGNEDDDTYRFKQDCENWYGAKIETICNSRYKTIQQVWYENLSLNVATGAKCSSELKRVTREHWQKHNTFSYQAFGFDVSEMERAKSMMLQYQSVRPIFPLISMLYDKEKCAKIVMDANDMFTSISLPRAYTEYGLRNNNCLKTGCVQGGVGYWQRMSVIFPDKFDAMAKVEHDLTDLKGEPVTMLKDQSKGGGLVFLKPHPKYPEIKDISMMKGRPVEPITDCNGFCGINDLSPRTETEKEINYAIS